MRKIVVFDFDGTLIKGDSFFPFLLSFKKWSLIKALPEVLLYPFLRDRTRLKEAMMQKVIAGISFERLLIKGEIFYYQWVSSRFKKEVLADLERHRKEGAYLVLVSANISPVLLPVKEKLGFDKLICSELQFRGDKATGKLSTPNCRGLEKFKRIEPLLDEGVFLEAYGDSDGDRELLERANSAHWIR